MGRAARNLSSRPCSARARSRSDAFHVGRQERCAVLLLFGGIGFGSKRRPVDFLTKLCEPAKLDGHKLVFSACGVNGFSLLVELLLELP